MSKIHLVILILLPKNIITRLIGYLANKSISRRFIPWYSKHYSVNLEQAEKKLPEYKTLNEFFTRRLKKDSRQFRLSDKLILSPVDGIISQIAKIDDNKLIQAKGRTYTLEQFIPNNAQRYKNGCFITIYLSPTDYHRIHHPWSGEITSYDYIPGYLFPVNPFSVSHIQELFAKNERLATYYSHQSYQPAIIKVGATIVGKIDVTYDKFTTNQNRQKTQTKTYHTPIPITQGEELGLFQMGSTVILLFEQDTFKLNQKWKNGHTIKLGEELGQWIKK